VKSSLSFGLFGNPYIPLALAVELGVILFIVYTPAGNWLFGTAPIGAEAWLLALAGAALMLGLEEMRKIWQRRRQPEELDPASSGPSSRSLRPSAMRHEQSVAYGGQVGGLGHGRPAGPGA
jgi:hypothetical protein